MSEPARHVPTLYLIDGHAEIFRAYYAIPIPLNSPVTGEPTQAVFGVAGMLLKLFDKKQPQYVAMAIDTPGETFRDKMFADYKANRQSPPDDFAGQVDRIFELVRLFGVPILASPGNEADDVIATVIRQLHDTPLTCDLMIRIVSKDKDLEQLLDERVVLYDIHSDKSIDAAWLMDNRGIRPDQVVDLLTLTGDKVDNVPGVEGVGPKTAAKLIQEFGSVQGVYEQIDKIKGKRRENLETARDSWPMSRDLVTLRQDVEINFELNQCAIGPIDVGVLNKLFRELGFRRHMADLDRLANQWSDKVIVSRAPVTTSPGGFAETLFDTVVSAERPRQREKDRFGTGKYVAITTVDQLQELTCALRKVQLLSVHVQTMNMDANSPLCGIALAWQPGQAAYVPMSTASGSHQFNEAAAAEELHPVLSNPQIAKCGHHLKSHWLALRRAGIRLRGVHFDCMVGAFLLGMPGRSLESLALELLGHKVVVPSPFTEHFNRLKHQPAVERVPLEQIAAYAGEQADMALRICEPMSRRLNEEGMDRLCEQVEMPLIEVLAEMQRNGIKLDPAVLAQQEHVLRSRITQLRDDIHDLVGEPFKLDSPKQLARILFQKLKLPVVKKTKTGASTDVKVLEKLSELEDVDDPQTSIPRLIIVYRQLNKLAGTYLGSLADSIASETGRVHATFHQTGAATGRLSSSHPNLQSIPVRTELGRQVRKAFIAEPEHVLISADYSQIELRILAHLSEDTALIDAFHHGIDIHTVVAAEVFAVGADQVSDLQRAHAKVINFGIIYGITAFGLARRIEGLDVDGAKTLINSYRKRFPGIDSFLNQCVEQAIQNGYVTTMRGRCRAIPQLTSANRATRSLGQRLAINSVVQGSAADLIKISMVNLHRRIEQDQCPMKLLLQIHDELVLETPQSHANDQAKIVKQVMQSAMSLRVPLKVDVGIGDNWLAAK